MEPPLEADAAPLARLASASLGAEPDDVRRGGGYEQDVVAKSRFERVALSIAQAAATQ